MIMEPGKTLYHINNELFLIYDGEQDGKVYAHVEDSTNGYVSESRLADSFLKHGYWQPSEE